MVIDIKKPKKLRKKHYYATINFKSMKYRRETFSFKKQYGNAWFFVKIFMGFFLRIITIIW